MRIIKTSRYNIRFGEGMQDPMPDGETSQLGDPVHQSIGDVGEVGEVSDQQDVMGARTSEIIQRSLSDLDSGVDLNLVKDNFITIMDEMHPGFSQGFDGQEISAISDPSSLRTFISRMQ